MLEVISEGGSPLDEGSDLNAMDAHLWHREYPFRRKRLPVRVICKIGRTCANPYPLNFCDLNLRSLSNKIFRISRFCLNSPRPIIQLPPYTFKHHGQLKTAAEVR